MLPKRIEDYLPPNDGKPGPTYNIEVEVNRGDCGGVWVYVDSGDEPIACIHLENRREFDTDKQPSLITRIWDRRTPEGEGDPVETVVLRG